MENSKVSNFIKTNGFVLGIVIAVIGLIIALCPFTVVRFLGLVAIIEGIYYILKVSSLLDKQIKLTVIIRSAAGILIGLLALFLPKTALVALEVIIGIYLLVCAAEQFFIAYRISLLSSSIRKNIIEGIAFTVAAILIFVIAGTGKTSIVRLLGIFILLAGIIYTLYAWKNRTIVVTSVTVRDYKADEDKVDVADSADVNNPPADIIEYEEAMGYKDTEVKETKTVRKPRTSSKTQSKTVVEKTVAVKKTSSSSAKKAPAKKTASKTAAEKTVSVKKAPAKKSGTAAKKSTSAGKTATKTGSAKKAASSAAKKTVSEKKAVSVKNATSSKAGASKSAAKKAPAKTAAKKSSSDKTVVSKK